MLTRPIPASGEALPAIGLGTYISFDRRLTPQCEQDLREVLQLFFAAGGRVIDSSPMYGRAEAVIGKLLEGMAVPEDAFIATKVYTRGRRAGVAEMEDSLRKMGQSSIALMQVHNLVDCDTHLETLREWKARGVIRYIGVTHYTTSAFGELARYVKSGAVDFIQFPYSIIDRQAEDFLLPLAADHGVATLINRPFEQQALFRAVGRTPLPAWAAEFGCSTWGQVFLKFILSHPAVTCAIPATGNPAHMADNLAAGIGRLPDGKARERMADDVGRLS